MSVTELPFKALDKSLLTVSCLATASVTNSSFFFICDSSVSKHEETRAKEPARPPSNGRDLEAGKPMTDRAVPGLALEKAVESPPQQAASRTLPSFTMS